MTQHVLILGASGRFGANAAKAFEAAGWQVHSFDRARDTLETAVLGMDVVVNAWNPPDYSTWGKDLLAMHRRVIAALKGRETTVIVPGNVYVFGAKMPGPWSEATSHSAKNPLGLLRIQMEAEYRASGVRTILLRAGDFLDTHASGNWFDLIMVKSLAKGRLTSPGNPNIPHAWAYLPDLARAAVALAEKRNVLAPYVDIAFPGYTLSGRDMADILSGVVQRPVVAKEMSWWPLKMLAPIKGNFRGLLEMRYLWNTPHALSGTRFAAELPDFQHTPVEDALRQAALHALPKPRGYVGQSSVA